MDARAGAATEADETGATAKQLQTLLTHDNTETQVRYIRRKSERTTGAIADLRKTVRTSESDGGTT